MVDLIKNNLDKIIDACKQHQVKSLYVIGSAARGKDFRNDSDIDFLYTALRAPDISSSQEFDYFDFLWKLEEITGKKVDLVANERVRNKYFLQSINQDKIKIYEA
jgi:uncharacterized protein